MADGVIDEALFIPFNKFLNMSQETMLIKELPAAINFRDVADIDSTRIKPGRVFRCSELFKQEVLSQHKIKTLIDMRNPGSGQETHPVYLALEDDTKSVSDDESMRVVRVDTIRGSIKLAILAKMPKRIWWQLFKCLYNGIPPSRVMCPAVCDPDCMGFKEFYKLLVDRAGAPISEILRIFADASNYPIMFHCTHGKDRTGIIGCILALITGITDEAHPSSFPLASSLIQAICQDYVQSGLQLQAAKAMYDLPLDDHLLEDQVISAPYEVIESLIHHFRKKYGGIEGYLHHIGIKKSEMQSIRNNLLQQL